jgi:membrane protease YdiL (CAAX protease family)
VSARVCIAAIIEIAYAVFTRTWLRNHAQGVELELLTTALRAGTAVAYWLMFRGVILSRRHRAGSIRLPLVLAGVATALAIPILFRGSSYGEGLTTAIVFALTSIVVGVREELLYRAVLLNLLEPRVGLPGALLISTSLFIVYHYGALPPTALSVTEVACMSLVLGLIYARTGSFVAVVALHAVYDAIWCFGPFLSTPLSDNWRPAFLLTALTFVLMGTWRVGGTRAAVSANGLASSRRP